MIYFELRLFVKNVSSLIQYGKLTVTGSIVRCFGGFHRSVAASNQCSVLCIRLRAQLFINIKIHYSQKLLVGCTQIKYRKHKIQFRQSVCQG